MLSESKIKIYQKEIVFFGTLFKDGLNTLTLRIASKLDKFLHSYLSKGQVQQFFGVVNYVQYSI